jgi:hypothetical protein
MNLSSFDVDSRMLRRLSFLVKGFCLQEWYGGAPEQMVMDLGMLRPQEWSRHFETILDVRSTGMGIIRYYEQPSSREGDTHLEINGRTMSLHKVVDGIPATTWSEIYTMCGLRVSATSLAILALKESFSSFVGCSCLYQIPRP